MPKRYALGLLPDRDDPRDRTFSATPHVLAALPAVVDLVDQLPEAYDQQALGACGPNAASANIQQNQKQQGLPLIRPSRMFLYYNTRAIMDSIGRDSGVSIRDMLKALNKWGFCREEPPAPNWEYNVEKFRDKPSDQCYADGLQSVIVDYKRVTANPAQLRGCLADKDAGCVIIGVPVYESFFDAPNGNVPMPGPLEPLQGGHAILVYGYDDSLQKYKFQNSWGKEWGHNGRGTLPYEYVHTLAADCWTINTIPGAVPNPTPPPSPPTPGPGGNVFLQILAMIKALQAHDWLGALKIFLAIIEAILNNQITAAECDVCHAALTAAYAAKKP